MTNLAPIILFAYNRPWNTLQTINALQKNDLASQSELFIYADGAKQKNDIKVEKVREYIKTIIGFKIITIIEREQNWGLADNIIDGVTEVVAKYGKIIVLEDDLITSKGFLKYMNEALEIYKDEKKVISIHAYNYPIKKKLPQTFFLKGADCWGWATWERGWKLYNNNAKELYAELIAQNRQAEFDFNNTYPFTKMLENQIHENKSWAIKWYASAFLQNKLTLYPGKSLVKNIGFGDEATNTKHNIFGHMVVNDYIIVKKKTIHEEGNDKKKIERYYKSIRNSKLSFFSKLKNFVFNLK